MLPNVFNIDDVRHFWSIDPMTRENWDITNEYNRYFRPSLNRLVLEGHLREEVTAIKRTHGWVTETTYIMTHSDE